LNGVLNLFYPVLAALDAALGFLPPVLRLVVLGALSGALAMGLYGLLSDQARIRARKAEMRRLQAALKAAKDDFAQTMRLSRRNLAVSLGLLGIVVGPALLSSLPLLVVIAWLSSGPYGYQLPAAGTPVPVSFAPALDGIAVEPAEALVRDGDGERLRWPAPGSPVRFLDAHGLVYAGPPADVPATTVRKRAWWNWLWGDEAGYVRADAPIEAISFALPPRTLIPGVPSWLGGWEAVYFLSVLVASLAIKVAFRIE
jgi:hypothetical protein